MDKNARIRDFYYPYVGQENHVSGNVHRVGVWVEDEFSWVSLEEWKLDIKYKKDTLVSHVRATSEELNVELLITEAVHPEKNIFIRKIEVKNKEKKKREIKIFFGQQFNISENDIGETVYYNPLLDSIIDYKGRRYFLIGGIAEEKSFDDYATGLAGEVDRLGTYVDAEDGILSKNAIEHGSVDSTIGFTLNLPPNSEKTIYYWITVGKKIGEVSELRSFILAKKPEFLIDYTENYWRKWVSKEKINFADLDDKIKDLFKRSLLIVKAQTDSGGAIIAANDSHTFRFKQDTYSYMWPRDGALIARSLDRLSHKEMTEKFFRFCANVSTADGFLLHKYRPDGSLGSSWHSWLKGKKIQLPIQEDETALVLDALWKHFLTYKDKEFAHSMYGFIKNAADFLAVFRDKKTKLPKESYDIWEEKLGIHTFTCCTVYAGLQAAMNFAKIFSTKTDYKKYEKAAKEIREAIIKYLYDEKEKTFIKGIYYDTENNLHKDFTIDASTAYGIFEYNVLSVNDNRVKNTMEKTLEKLFCKSPSCGLGRYENDQYHRTKGSNISNPWFIATLWLVEYYIAKAQKKDDLLQAKELLEWVAQKALPTGVLSEQIDPVTGESLSVAPLTWSHAGFIIAVDKYLEKLESLKKK
ncbi:glycoside hydrolase family 15 protein [Candidatus Pacearchaeota archaeon]|nr:glycoside hydrolase family 15 protein [Candidatus Pacearchaeota archaeon]